MGYVLRIDVVDDTTSLALHGIYDSRTGNAYRLDQLDIFVTDINPEDSYPNDTEVEDIASRLRQHIQKMFSTEFDGKPNNSPSRGNYQLQMVMDEEHTLSTIRDTAMNIQGRYNHRFTDPVFSYVMKQMEVVITPKPRIYVLRSAVEKAILQDDDNVGIEKRYDLTHNNYGGAHRRFPQLPQASVSYIDDVTDDGTDDAIISFPINHSNTGIRLFADTN